MVRESSCTSSEKQESGNLRGCCKEQTGGCAGDRDLAHRQSSIVAAAFKEKIAFL